MSSSALVEDFTSDPVFCTLAKFCTTERVAKHGSCSSSATTIVVERCLQSRIANALSCRKNDDRDDELAPKLVLVLVVVVVVVLLLLVLQVLHVLLLLLLLLPPVLLLALLLNRFRIIAASRPSKFSR
jgi:hypothetical protein